MSQSFDLTGPSVTTHVQFNGADCEKMMLNGVRIWERYIAQQQVWVTSGYNTTQETLVATYWSWWYSGNGTRWGSDGWSSWYGGKWVVNGSFLGTGMGVMWSGGYKYTWGGSYFWLGNANATHHQIFKWSISTVWVDTSSYETQNVTAYYY